MGIFSMAVHVLIGCLSALSRGIVLAGFATALMLVFLAYCFCLLVEAGQGHTEIDLKARSDSNT